MANRRKAHLDALEVRLTGPKKIALFGHRAVGKTTLLAMFYRQASAGRVPGVRLAAAAPETAEYLAEKIAQLEAGEPPAGTLAETELHLRLYHDRARFDLIVKDYQGEDVTLGRDAPIRGFFADCEAVFLCLDPEGGARPAERRRRQQEVEELLERYIEASDDGTAGRPVAVLVTRYDRVLARGGPPPERVGELLESRYGMTRHLLAQHAPRSALFAVSSFGPGAEGDRPPAELHPMGLDGPLGWLAEQLEAIDRDELEWIWDLAPEDLTRLTRCARALAHRYPQSGRFEAYEGRLKALRRKRLRRRLAGAVLAAGLLVAIAAGYDLAGYRAAVAFGRGDYAAPAVERRWEEFLAWHPLLPVLWPARARAARDQLRAWQVKAAAVRVAVGAAPPGLDAELARLKEEAPHLAGDIRRVEEARARQRHDERWRALRAGDLDADEPPETRLAAYRAFLREFPDSPHQGEARAQLGRIEVAAAERRDRTERQELDALRRELALPDPDLPGAIERARAFLAEHPDSPNRPDAEAMLEQAAARSDAVDIQKARDFSAGYPTSFATRRRKYEDYLAAHREGGRFVREALDAIARIDREKDVYAYRKAYDHAAAHPDDVAVIAGLLRSYLDAHPEGRFAAAARSYLSWWDGIREPAGYRVTLRRGRVEPTVGKYLSGGGPDLAVEVWVAGVKYGPSPVAPNTRDPVWDYTFPRPIRWKSGDPVVIRILDFDWSSGGTGVFRLTSPKGDPLAMRYLSGEVRPGTKPGRTMLLFASDFQVPQLPKPE